MASLTTHRLSSPIPQAVVATIEATGAADVSVNGFTIDKNPGNIVSTFAYSAAGVVVITLAQPWAGIDNVLVSCDLDDFTVTVDSAVASTGVITLTTRKQSADASADTDVDGGVLRVTLVLRLQ